MHFSARRHLKIQFIYGMRTKEFASAPLRFLQSGAMRRRLSRLMSAVFANDLGWLRGGELCGQHPLDNAHAHASVSGNPHHAVTLAPLPADRGLYDCRG